MIKTTIKAAALFLALNSGPSLAITTTHNPDDIAALSNTDLISNINFESQATDLPPDQNEFPASLQISTTAPEGLIIKSAYPTTSGQHYLGAANSDGAFLASDQLRFQFSEAIHAFGLYIISEESLNAGDFILSSAAGEVFNSTAVNISLTNSGAYYLGFILDAADPEVTEVVLKTSDTRWDFNINYDDIQIATKQTVVVPPTTIPPTESGNKSGGGGAFTIVHLLLFSLAGLSSALSRRLIMKKILSTLLLAGLFISGNASAQEPFLGEIRWVGFNFTPRGWAPCNGQILSIAQNTALFSLLGTTYGGDGRTTFAVPDLRGRAPINAGQAPGLKNYRLGEIGGQETVTLSIEEMPAHTHTLKATAANANSNDPTNKALAAKERTRLYSDEAASIDLDAGSISTSGASQAHENRPPYTTLNCIIALQGIFPSRE